MILGDTVDSAVRVFVAVLYMDMASHFFALTTRTLSGWIRFVATTCSPVNGIMGSCQSSSSSSTSALTQQIVRSFMAEYGLTFTENLGNNTEFESLWVSR